MKERKINLILKIATTVVMALLMVLVFTPEVQAYRCKCTPRYYHYPKKCPNGCNYYYGYGVCDECGGSDTRPMHDCPKAEKDCGCCGRKESSCICSYMVCDEAHCDFSGCPCNHTNCGGGHNYNTLSSNSSGHWYVCSCNDTTSVTNHSGGSATCTSYGTCSTCGYAYLGPHGHNHNILRSNSTQHWYECAYCSSTDNYGSHYGGSATCTAKANCTLCGTAYGDTLGHNWNSYYTTNGSVHYIECTRCTETLSYAGHSGGHATCEDYGRCSTCNYPYLPPLGHTGGVPTCTDHGYCTRCGAAYIPPNGHSLYLTNDYYTHWYACHNCSYTEREASHYGGTPTCVLQPVCSYCGRSYDVALGHDWNSYYTTTSSVHYIECTRCTEIKGYGSHSDVSPLNGRCDTCNYITDYTAPTATLTSNLTYEKAHTATLTVSDAGGAFLSPGTYTVQYGWTTSSTPTYGSTTTLTVGSGQRTASTTISKNGVTGEYYLHVKLTITDTVGNSATLTPSSRFNFDNTLPTISIDKNTNYLKSQTATITFEDRGGSLLEATSYTLSYAWTMSSSTPSSYTNTTTTTVGSSKSTHTTTITKSDGTGIYYLHVKLNKAVTDNATNASAATTLCGVYYLDNTAPTIDMIPVTTYTPLSSRSTHGVDFEVTEKHVGINTAEFTASDVIVYVAGRESAATKRMEYLSVSNGVYKFRLTLSNIPETGEISFRVVNNAIPDTLGNPSVQMDFPAATTNLFADNTIPEIKLNGQISVESITSGKNLSGVTDPRYVNKEYEIEIPIIISDLSGLDMIEVFDENDFTVSAGTAKVTPTKTVTLVREYYRADAATGLKTFYKEYTITLKGLTEDGYLKLTMLSGAIMDSAQNVNLITELEPYTVVDGKNFVVYVDNTIPRVTITEVLGNAVIDSNMFVRIELYVKDVGAGIRADQFVTNDINVQIDGKTVTDIVKDLKASTGNNYDTALGGKNATNYTYEFAVSGIDESGTLRLEIPVNKIIDKANNGNEPITLTAEIKIDNEGPKLGNISTNADSQGEVIGETVKVKIIDCKDDSGIASYEWQRSLNKEDWETVKVENSSLAESLLEQDYVKENAYYYRVIVSDTLGNTSISDVVQVTYKTSLDGKPTISLSQRQINSDLVVVDVVVKTMVPVEKIVVNGSEIAKSKYKDNVVQNNFEYTTTMNYDVTDNGVYKFDVTDERGNVASDSINVSLIDSTKAIVSGEAFDVTLISPARIVFTSNEPVRIINPNGYSGITFKETNFATKIEATISPDELFVDDRIFTFENKGLLPVEVEIKAPIITKLTYVRFSNALPVSLDITLKEVDALVRSIPSSKVMSASGRVESYYGFEKDNVNVKIATESVLNLAEKVGGAAETFIIDDNGQRVKLEPHESISKSNNSNYVTDTTSGMYKLTTNLLDDYRGGEIVDSGRKYNSFRIMLIP